MAEPNLHDRRVLVVEDEYLLADELRIELIGAGATVVGPASTVDNALGIIGSGPTIDGAILDLNLRGDLAFPIADQLMARGVPFVITTGYDASAIPPRFSHIPLLEKPADAAGIAEAIGRAMRA